MSGATFGLWAFGVFCGAAVVWFYCAYKETKDAAGLSLDKQIDPAGYGGPGPVDPK